MVAGFADPNGPVSTIRKSDTLTFRQIPVHTSNDPSRGYVASQSAMCPSYGLSQLSKPTNAPSLSIQALLGAPNPDDPLANDVAQHWKENEKAAIAQAREWTRVYAN
jgi:hypothetical protein